MKKENKEILIGTGFIIFFILAVYSVLNINSIFKLIHLNYDKFFAPYVSMGIWFWIILIGFTVAMLYLRFGGKKEIEEES